MIKIQYSPDQLGWLVYEYRQTFGTGFREVRQGTEWVIVKEGEPVSKPSYIIENLDEWAKAIAEVGVKVQSDYKLEGILEAQNKHLQDMRKLVFRKGSNE